jgi:hypothetical protein
MEITVVWNCPNCEERNITDIQALAPVCAECGREYEWCDHDFLSNVSHQEELSDNGEFDADAYDPDMHDCFQGDDDQEPEDMPEPEYYDDSPGTPLPPGEKPPF